MPLSETDLKYLWDMLDAAHRAVKYTRGVSREQFLSDGMRCDAAVHVIEVMGEAARRVSSGARAELAEIEWSAIIATRHILAHEYDDIDHEIIWRIATHHVPILIDALEPILRMNPPGPEASEDLLNP